MLSKKQGQREKGMTVAMLAVFIVGLFGMAALAIDLGILYTARTSAQHAADAAALAGAMTFTNPGVLVQPVAAIDAAIATAGANFVLGKQVVINATDVNVDIPNRLVTVTVPLVGGSGIATYFARVFSLQGAGGMQRVDVVVQASAEAAETAGGSQCVKPLFVPNTILSPLDPTLACAPLVNQLVFETPSNPANCGQPAPLTTFANAQVATHGVFLLKPGNPQDALTPSQFYALDFGAGGSDYRCTLGSCMNDCGITDTVACGDDYPVKTGNMIGPTRQGVDDLVGPTPDTWVAVGVYADPDQVWHDTSAQLVIAPVWDNCCQTITPGTNGQTARVVGFMTLFIDGMQGNDVQAHLVDATECPGAGGAGGPVTGPVSGASGPTGRPVRLVQTPTGP
ncbi:MAG: pilus assembly protein TadG-related protein [Terriglobales bacterium]